MSDELQNLSFTANARLKDIVGRGLINDDNIAIIELIKNSKDAGSPTVSVSFQESKKYPETTDIFILDHGAGMTLDDIKYKWLNIAYSEKRNATPKDGGGLCWKQGDWQIFL